MSSDTTENLTPTMSEEDVKKVQDTLKEIQEKSEGLSQIYDAMNGEEDTIETGEQRLMNVSIDPVTGKALILNAEEVTKEESEPVDELLGSDFDIELDQSPITLEELSRFIKTADKESDAFKGLSKYSDFNADDLTTILDLAIKFQNKEEITSLFHKLPKSMQDAINKAMGPGYENTYSKDINSFRNTMAEIALEEIVSSVLLERANNTINTGVEKIFSTAAGEIGDTIVGYTEERNKAFRAEIESKIEDPEKKAQALDILDHIENAYKLAEFKEFCKVCKIKKIDVEKPTEHKNYDIDALLRKYEGSKTYNIYNIYNAQSTLTRTINADNEEFNDKQLRAFFVAFAKYCKNYSPTNTLEHIFMFYTIYNVMLTDVNIGEKSQVSKDFLENVKECIRSLTNRNAFLA